MASTADTESTAATAEEEMTQHIAEGPEVYLPPDLLLDTDGKWITVEASIKMGMTDQAMALLDESEEQSVLFITPRSSVVSAISEHLSKATGLVDKHDN
jgi:hypothetical protein